MTNTLYTQVLHLAAFAVVAFLLVYEYVTGGDPTPLWIPFAGLVGIALPSPFTGSSQPVGGSLP